MNFIILPFVLEPFVKDICQTDSCSARGKNCELKRYKKIEALENYIISTWAVPKSQMMEVFTFVKTK